jgi:spore germination protein
LEPNKQKGTLFLQPPSFPFVTFAQANDLWRNETIISGSAIHYDDAKAAAWFEFKNASSGQRHQVWFDNARSVEQKARWIWKEGFKGISFWTR